MKKSYAHAWFSPLETSAIERVETLLSKWSDDNEIYWVKRLKSVWEDISFGLRFDLTVPLARYIAQNQGALIFPMRTAHIGKSWRWERPQKWRFREFYQADIDIIGIHKIPLLADVEIISTIQNALKNLNFGWFTIHINNRKLLNGFLKSIWIEDSLQVISLIDKKDKVDDIDKLFSSSSLDNTQKQYLKKFLDISSKYTDISVLEHIENDCISWKIDDLYIEGKNEIIYLYDTLQKMGVPNNDFCIDLSIARGLNYYTGLVFETFLDGKRSFWSVSSWGRYENLCEKFCDQSFPWVWWSIWISRLLSILESDIDIKKSSVSEVLVINTGNQYRDKNLQLISDLRWHCIKTELFLDENAKFSKQFKYADNKWIPYAIIFGEKEDNIGKYQLKSLNEWKQWTLSYEELLSFFTNK